MERFFKLKENGTTVSREIIAGLTTFFAMAYIIVVNPNVLSGQAAGTELMPWGAVFLATIIASIIGTLIMGLVANVPYAQAPGMGLNAFFVYTVCLGLGFTWQQTLSMVFICGLINIFITVTKIRKYIIKAIPRSLQNAIGGGIGLFVAYIGILNVGIVNFDSGVPALATLNQPALWLFIIGLVLTIVLQVCKVKGAILIGIVATTLIGIPMGVTVTANTISFQDACQQLPTTFGAIFTSAGLPSLFSDMAKLPLVLVTIFAFSISDTFDTIGTFIGTGRRTGIFSDEDERSMETNPGFKSKMDKALFADATATSIGAIFGTSNTTTFVESAAGIGAGGRTGLTSVVVALCFAASAFLACAGVEISRLRRMGVKIIDPNPASLVRKMDAHIVRVAAVGGVQVPFPVLHGRTHIHQVPAVLLAQLCQLVVVQAQVGVVQLVRLNIFRLCQGSGRLDENFRIRRFFQNPLQQGFHVGRSPVHAVHRQVVHAQHDVHLFRPGLGHRIAQRQLFPVVQGVNGAVRDGLQGVPAAHAARCEELGRPQQAGLLLPVLGGVQVQLQADGIADKNGVVKIRILRPGRLRQRRF